jgi:hypothetical protein
MKWTLFSLSLVIGAHAWPSRAEACGCFALPSPSTPVVQAGERILFAHDGNDVIAYIQISYQGQASEFGWLVPLPTVPTLELGSDLLFTALEQNTQPQYQLSTKRLFCSGGSSTSTGSIGGCGDSAENGAFTPQAPYDAGMSSADLGSSSPVVEKSSIGPYDYVVLKADDSTAMFQWLSDNRYFVPSGTMNAVTPYIHPGAFFLALKLRAGETAGDIQPIVLRYASDLAMIPIILTSVGAIPNMGVEVFELGEFRAIPRNYHHSVLNQTSLWYGADYNALLIRAVQEAPMHHAFVTEYAGTSTVMQNSVWAPGRYGDPNILRTFTQPVDFLSYLVQYRYTLDATLLAILEKYIPEPQNLIDSGVTPTLFYRNFGSYEGGGYMEPNGDGGVPVPFDPNACTDEIVMRILTPLENTQTLLDSHPYLTRLYTRLSPEDMTADPVFSENPDLPDVAPLHTATVTIPCNSTTSWIDTDQGFTANYSIYGQKPPVMPATLRLETLRDSGAPQTEQDNTQAIKDAIGPVSMDTSGSTSDRQGCQVDGRQTFDATLLLVIAGAILSVRARRRYSMRNNPRF